MLAEAETGARQRIAHWADGTYRAVTFSDAVGLAPGLAFGSPRVIRRQAAGTPMTSLSLTVPRWLNSDGRNLQMAQTRWQ